MEIERIERTGRGTHGHIGDLQVARRGLQVGVTEQDLDGAQIGPGFEQVCGEGVPQRVRMNRFPNTGGSGDPPASAAEVGSQRSSFRL